MRTSTQRTLAVILGSALLLLALGGSAAVAQKQNPTAAALKTLVSQTKALPKNAASKAKKRKLAKLARRARRVFRTKPCKAVRDLVRYRRVLLTIRPKQSARARNRLARLAPTSLKASRRLLARKATARCGGGVTQNNIPAAETKVLRSDVNGMELEVQLPPLRFNPRVEDGKTWTELKLPDTDSPQAPGSPGVPVVSKAFAIPDGATVTVTPGQTQSMTLDGVEVFPVQEDPVDQDEPRPDFDSGPFAFGPFEFNRQAYQTDGFQPPQPAAADSLGAFRDLTIGGLQVPAAQYNAPANKLKVFTTVNLTVAFNGGPKTFNEELSSPWETPAQSIISTLINRNIITLNQRFVPRRCGEEMLVITNPATRPAADQFANAKRAQGMRTSVFETGTGTAQIGTTAAQIQTFIRGRLTQFLCVHPSYVTIMGDDDLVPTFAGINGIPSDLPYSMRNDTDELPDVAVGRFIGNDNAAITNAVTKVVNYENSPPTGPMLSRATIAAQFQDDDNNGQENRTFIQFAETVRSGLVARGVAVDRIYGEHPGNNPQKFNDGTNLPAAIKKPTFAWDGDGADVTAAWNDGRFMVIHRDHGWSDGWGTPGYSTGNVQALTNGANLPVVLSINCSSGAYDYDETSFAGESLVKANGGSVGVFGDTRDSPSWHNTQIAFGFVDGLLPSVLPGEGPASKQRVGNALITGKLRLAGLAPPATDGSTRNELYLWHYFGDPSMQMWGGGVDPLVFVLTQFRAVYKKQLEDPGPDPPPYLVEITLPSEFNGQPIALLQDGEVIGKAIAANGIANVPADFDSDDVNVGKLEIAIEADGAQPIKIPVSGETSLTQSCPEEPVASNNEIEVNGNLAPSVADATVIVKYTRPDGSTFERTVQTDQNGNWTSTIVPIDEDGPLDGDWKVQARYAGDSSHAGALAPECTVSTFNNS
jgi:hypothetical protein